MLNTIAGADSQNEDISLIFFGLFSVLFLDNLLLNHSSSQGDAIRFLALTFYLLHDWSLSFGGGKDAAPHMQKGSSVVLISSITGYNPYPSLAMYGVTKTALLGLTKAGEQVLHSCYICINKRLIAICKWGVLCQMLNMVLKSLPISVEQTILLFFSQSFHASGKYSENKWPAMMIALSLSPFL